MNPPGLFENWKSLLVMLGTAILAGALLWLALGLLLAHLAP